MFKAASFAEGWGDNFIFAYMPGAHSLNINEYYFGDGKNPYEDPTAFLSGSPAFHLKGVTTAVLLEAGERSGMTLNVPTVSALWRTGIPHEYIVYPDEPHGLLRPRALVEAAQINLDWFEYWIMDRRDPAIGKAEQYQRWDLRTKEMEGMREYNDRRAKNNN